MKARNTGKTARRNRPEAPGRAGSLLRKAKVVGIAVLVVAAAAAAVRVFPTHAPAVLGITGVVVSGNEHLTDEELRQIAGISGNESLLTLSEKEVYAKLAQSPWIREASVRKEYPGTLLIRIRETEPFALLDMKGKTYIVDDQGRMLEELTDNTVPFLPVILSDPYSEKDAYREAVALAKTIKTMGILHRSQRIEIIAHRPNELTANLDGVIVKIGAGEHQDKLTRLLDVEEEIRKRNIPVGYIDLRFAKKVVVKPVNEVIQ